MTTHQAAESKMAEVRKLLLDIVGEGIASGALKGQSSRGRWFRYVEVSPKGEIILNERIDERTDQASCIPIEEMMTDELFDLASNLTLQ